MKLPRDLSGPELAKTLRAFGYRVTRQSGSHMRLTTSEHGEHASLRVGTLAGILSEVATHFEMTRDEVVERLFGV